MSKETPERMLNKMKNNSKSGLCLKQVIAVVMLVAIMSTRVQLFERERQGKEIANKEEKKEIVQNEIQEVQIATTYEREGKTTVRSAQERTAIEQEETIEKVQYKTIEEITIARDMDLTQRCGISKEDFKTLMTNLKTDTSGFFEQNSDTIYDLCETYEINEIFFCGLIAAESGWKIASSHRNANNYISMMSKGKLIRYASPEEGLEAAAKLLHNRYLTPGGSCYYGKTLASVQRRFCPNSSTWVGLVYGCMKQVVK